MTYAVTISGNNISFSMAAVEYAVSLSQSGLQGATGPAGTVTANTGATINGDLNITDKIVHAGDTNTAIRFPANDTVTVETAGAERARFDSTGNFGIGTPSPISSLDVIDVNADTRVFARTNGTSDYAAFISAQNDYFSTFASLEMRRYEGGVSGTELGVSKSNLASLFAINSDALVVGTNGGSPVVVSTSGSERLRVDSTGNVGIGTSAPGDSLHIAGATPGIRLQDTDGTNQYGEITHVSAGLQIRSRNNASNGVIQFLGVNGIVATEWMRIQPSGNVGINEPVPDYKLDVNGTFGFTPGASVTPVDNGDVVFELTNNTTLTIKAKGSDGVVRSGTVTLA